MRPSARLGSSSLYMFARKAGRRERGAAASLERILSYRLSAPKYLRAISRKAVRSLANPVRRSAHSCEPLAGCTFWLFVKVMRRLASTKRWYIRSAHSMTSGVPVARTAK